MSTRGTSTFAALSSSLIAGPLWLLVGCGGPARSPVEAAGAGLASPAETTIFEAPADVCRDPAPPIRARLPVGPDTAPLRVVVEAPARAQPPSAGPQPASTGPQTAASPPVPPPPPPAGQPVLSLHSRGARAGRVLVTLGEAAGKSLLVDGAGADVRIYAHVAKMEAGALIAAVARAAGLVEREEVVGTEYKQSLFLDPYEAVRRARGDRAGMLSLWTLETRRLRATHPIAAARVLAELVLGCRGKIAAAPEQGFLLVSDMEERLKTMEKILDVLDDPAPEIELGEEVVGRGHLDFGIPDPVEPSCAGVPEVAPPLWDGGPAAGVAAGDVVRRTAETRGRDVIIGCGGDSAVHLSAPFPAALDDLAWHMGLRALGEITFESQENREQRQHLEHARTRKPGPNVLRGYVTPSPERLREALIAWDSGLRAAAYLPTSMVLVSAPASVLESRSWMVKGWTSGAPH